MRHREFMNNALTIDIVPTIRTVTPSPDATASDALTRRIAALEGELAAANEALNAAQAAARRGVVSSIRLYSALIELRSAALFAHGRRVAELARRLAEALQWPDAPPQDVFVAGLLHDIGHIGLSNVLLDCPVHRMTDDDLARYRKHAFAGERALLAAEGMERVATMVRSHHERHDGRGFPDGLAGKAIPAGARILALVDTFDDLQSGHLSGHGAKASDACAAIAGFGNRFDPDVVDAFMRLMQGSPGALHKPIGMRTGQLTEGMVLANDLVSDDGIVLLRIGQCLNEELILRLRGLERRDNVRFLVSIQPAA